MFGLFNRNKKNAAPSWKSLNPRQRAVVMHRLANVYRGMARYKIVSGFDQSQREQG